MSKPPADEYPREQCRLAEILQFQCDAEVASGGDQRVHCLPVPRIFRMYVPCTSLSPSLRPTHVRVTWVSCKNRPAVEMTRFVDVDLETGAVHLPSQSRSVLIRHAVRTEGAYRPPYPPQSTSSQGEAMAGRSAKRSGGNCEGVAEVPEPLPTAWMCCGGHHSIEYEHAGIP